MKIATIVCHGIRPKGSGTIIPNPLPADQLERLVKIAHDMGFESISYDDLAGWRAGRTTLPPRPIMINFDHPVRSLRYQVLRILDRHDFRANLFMYTRPYDSTFDRPLTLMEIPEHLTWSEIRELVAAGWLIGAHTVTHPNFSELSVTDPDGEILRRELDRCNLVIQENLGIAPRDFAFTGISWSSLAEEEVKKRYRFGRLWTVGAQYLANGKPVRYADLVGVNGTDEADGGPPWAARYITQDTDAYRLPSMELQGLINSPEAFRQYLEGALSRE